MSRVKRGFKARHRRNKILKMAKGYWGVRHKCFKQAKQTVTRAMCYAYRDRKNKKREYRALWNIRIGAACKELGFSYSRLIGGLAKAGVSIDRKILAELAVTDPKAFSTLVETAKAA